jgi:tetratricopeptide (TPR) repeat protein
MKDFSKAIELNTKKASVYINRAKLFEENSNIDNAISDLTKALAYEPQNAKIKVIRGSLFYRKKEYIKAISDFDEVIKNKIEEKNIFQFRANSYFEIGEYKKAIGDFNILYSKFRVRTADLFLKRGISQKKVENYREAIKDFTKVIARDRKNFAAYYNCAEAYSKVGKDIQAIQYFNKALEINDKCSNAYLQRGIFYLSKKEYKIAIEDFSKSLKLEKTADAFFYRGAAYYEISDLDKACNDLNKAIEHGSEKAKARKKKICL